MRRGQDPTVVVMANQAKKERKCVVIGLLSTGEAVATRYFKDQGTVAVAELKEAEDAPALGRRRRGGPRTTYAVPDTSDEEDYDTSDDDGRQKKKKKMKKKKPAPAKKKRARSDSEDDSNFDEHAARGGGGLEEGDDDDDNDDAAGGGEGLEEDEDDDGFVGIESTLLDLIKKHVPDNGQGRYSSDGTPFDYAQRKKELMNKVKAQRLPQFPLDDLIRELGGAGEVAEITGRKCRVEFNRHGEPVQINRAKALRVFAKDVNIHEMRAFQAGEKLVAIISEAGSTGFSLHADRRAKNQRRRVHMTIEVGEEVGSALWL